MKVKELELPLDLVATDPDELALRGSTFLLYIKDHLGCRLLTPGTLIASTIMGYTCVFQLSHAFLIAMDGKICFSAESVMYVEKGSAIRIGGFSGVFGPKSVPISCLRFLSKEEFYTYQNSKTI